MNRYLYIDEHEIFFCSFLCELHQSLSKLAENQHTWKLDKPIMWTTDLVGHLEVSENKIVRVVDYWMDSILGRFIIEVVIDTSANYTEAEQRLFKGPRGKYLKSLKTWIKYYCARKGLCH